jgi:hypothetical protein
MKKIVAFLTLIFLLMPLDSYSCECVHISSSFTKRIEQAEEIVLGHIVNELSNGYLEIEIIKDENQTIGYDFTVSDNYTFCTDDGVCVQDTMAIYVPITKEAIEDNRKKNKIEVKGDLDS